MKIFVPHYCHTAPSTNSRILDEMFLEIHEGDLPAVIDLWKSLEKLEEVTPKAFFSVPTQKACLQSVRRNALEPFLRRPHITLHCGAKDGSFETGPLAKELMYTAGQLVAKYGFNLWYGGGDSGVMGIAHKGFRDQIARERFQDQYSVQIVPAPFVYGVKSTNGLSPANEGLGKESDIVMITPDFMGRRALLDSICAAALSGIGAIGSCDEIFDILVHKKTGLRPTDLYILNPHIPELGRPYWEPLKDLIDGFIRCGFENPQTLSHVNFMPTPEAAMEALMAKLTETHQTPHEVYEAYCRLHKIAAP